MIPIITVSGARSGVGKTLLVEKILKRLKGWSALKVTVVKDSPCPRNHPCGVCEDQEAPFTIVSDRRVISQKGKDTARMKSAGAKRVLWLKATPEGLKRGVKTALKIFKGSPGVVIEGTSVLKYIKPNWAFFLHG